MEDLSDGGIGSCRVEQSVVGSVERHVCRGFVIEQLIALECKAVVDTTEGEFSCAYGVNHYS